MEFSTSWQPDLPGMLPLVLMLSGVILTVLLLRTGSTLLAYPVATVTLGTLLFILKDRLPTVWMSFRTSDTRIRAVKTAAFVGVAALIYVGRTPRAARSDAYFLLYLVVIGVILLGAVVSPDRLSILQVLLVSVAVRARLFNAAPILGKDSTAHIAIVGYTQTTGELIPRSISHYNAFPLSHVAGSVLGLVSGLSPRISTFVAFSVISILMLLLVYYATLEIDSIGNSTLPGIIAVVLVVVSWPHMNRLSIPIAQTVSLVFVTLALYLYARSNLNDASHERGATADSSPPRTYDALLVVSLLTLVFIHHLPPIIFAIFLSGMVVHTVVEGTIFDRPDANRGRKTMTNVSLVVIMLMASYFGYLSHANSFSIQMKRSSLLLLSLLESIYGIAGPANNLGATVAREQNEGAILSTDILINLDPLLLYAGSFLVFLVLLTIGGLYVLEFVANDDFDSLFEKWFVSTGLLFSFVMFAQFMATNSHISRGFPTLIILVSPAVAIVAVKFRNDTGTVGTAVLVILLITGAYFGIASPPTAVPERTNGFQPMLTDSEKAVVNHVNTHEIESWGHPYVAGRAKQQVYETGTLRQHIYVYYYGYPPPKSLFVSYAAEHPNTPFVHREFYEQRGRVSPPKSYSTVYDSGSASIIVPNGSASN